MNEILGIKLVQLNNSYVNDITDMHVTCSLSDIIWGFCCAVCKDRSRDYNDRQCGSDVNWDFNL